MIALVATVALLIVRHDDGTVAGLSTREFGAAAHYLLLIVFLGSALVVLFRERLVQALKAALIWLAIAAAIAVGYTYRDELRQVADRVLAELIPGRAATLSANTVEIVRGRAGDFQVAAQ